MSNRARTKQDNAEPADPDAGLTQNQKSLYRLIELLVENARPDGPPGFVECFGHQLSLLALAAFAHGVQGHRYEPEWAEALVDSFDQDPPETVAKAARTSAQRFPAQTGADA